MTRPAILTAAIVGAETTRDQNPHLPLTAEEIGVEAARCRDHAARGDYSPARPGGGRGRPSQSRDLFAQAIEAICRRTDVIIQTPPRAARSGWAPTSAHSLSRFSRRWRP